MTGEQLDEKAIFNAARAIESPEARAEYLRQACSSDAELIERIQTLLRGYEEQASFLESPPAAIDVERTSLFDERIAEQQGTVIGLYKLLQQIGEGGMGVVFMAEQTEPIQRNVALKIIKPGMDSRQVIARFEAERQALAMMDHPNIAKVHDAGTTETGRPYFVMELVKGVPITKYCDEKQFSIRQRLELFKPVCEAVQHAHQKGIIHRDLKPTNVLVAEYDNRAIPKVIDFGVAKATAQRLTERTMFTEFGQVIGTVEYMSPEQAKFNQLDIDTRSDIYSLGVLLYELLTGSTPFEQKRLREAAFDEVLRIIREEEPPKPSTKLSNSDALPSIAANRHTEPARLSKDVCGELDWIVMKALEKDRNRRYETANGFARDIERYLHDEPVQASPASAVYQFRKFARRHKVALAVTTAALATLLLVILGLLVSNRLIASERNEKANALALAEARRARSDANFMKAIVAVRDIITGTALGSDNVPLPLRRKFSDQAMKFYESLIQENSPDASLQYDSAVGYRTIAMLHQSWGEFEQAEKCYRKAIAMLDRLSSQHPTVQQYRYQLGYAHLVFSRKLYREGRFQEAKPVVDRGIDLYEKLSAETPESADYISPLADFYFDALQYRVRAGTRHGDDPLRSALELMKRAESLLDAPPPPHLVPGQVHTPWAFAHKYRLLAFALRAAGRLDEAEQMLQKAIRLFEKLIDKEPENVECWHYLADTHREVGLVLNTRNKPEEAEQEFRQAIQIHEQRVAKFPDDRVNDLEWSLAYLDLARLLIKTGRVQQAIPLVTRGVEVDPMTEGQPVKLKAQLQLANVLREAREFDEAVAQYTDVIAAKSDMAEAYIGRGECYLEKREFDRAADDLSAVIGLYQKLPSGAALRSGELLTLGAFCRTFAEQGGSHTTKAAELALKAVPLYQAALAEYERLTSVPARRRDALDFAVAYEQVAIALTQAGESAAAEKALRNAQQVWVKLLAADNSEENRWKLGVNCELLGYALRKAGRLEMSVQSYQQATDIWEKLAAETGKEDHRNHLRWQRATLVELFRSQGKTAEADAVFQKAEAQCRDAIRQRPDAAELHRSLADVLRDEGKLDEAIAAYSQVIARNPDDQDAWKQRGACYLRKGNLARAVEYFTEAIKQKPDDSWYWHERAYCYLCLGQHEKAIADISKAIELNDVDPEQRVRRGHSYKALGEFQQAEADYARAIELNPRLWESWHARGQLHIEMRHWDKAAADFTKVIDLEPKRSEGWTSRAFSHFHRQQWDKAVADFTKAIELDPKVHTNWLHRGHTYLQLRQWNKAEADFGKIVEQWPQDSGGWFFLAAAHAQLNQPSKALSDLRQAMANGFKDIEHLKTYSLLDPIRSKSDFQKLVAELEEKKK